jgi:hypothetical protein
MAGAASAAIQEEGAAAVNDLAGSSLEAGWRPLRKLWAEPAGDPPPQVRWWKDAGFLIWEMKMELPWAVRGEFESGGFVEGLWDRDVAEFFILDRGSGAYQEFNLGPGGAWWSAWFVAPRVRAVPQLDWTRLGVQTAVTWTPAHWTGQMRLRLPDYGEPAVNFCAIRRGPGGAAYYSLAGLGGETPDFHRPQEWIHWPI